MINSLNGICLGKSQHFHEYSQEHYKWQAASGDFLNSHSLSYALGPLVPENKCQSVKWCAVGHHEKAKCDEWSISSNGKINCESAEFTEDCIAKIMVCHSMDCLYRAMSLPLLPACP